jgi:myosin-18
MLELRLYNTKKSIEEELEKDDLDGLSSSVGTSQSSGISSTTSSTDSNLLKIQMDKLKKDNDALKKQLKQEKENLQQLNTNDRSFFESKLKEKDNELLELEKQTALHKRKYQKLCEEMQDLQRMCDESKVRNRDLEKQQLKFDAELQSWKTKYDNEKETREKCERERDTNKYELYALKSELDAQKMETQYHIEKCERLERDLKEYETANHGIGSGMLNGSGGGSDQFIKMKAQIREMEAKLRDQEEELDEQTGSIQQLEQNKLRLEMQLEKEKQKWQRELAEKESEMDDLRFHTQKKIKAIEMQLEEESELNSNLQREKRDLDRKLREFTSNSNNGKNRRGYYNGDLYLNGAINEYIAKLKRQMLKYKTLAIDAQTQLEKLKQNIPKQSIMKSLKSQLEDSEISKANALKTKQLLQVEINDLQEQLEETNMHKQSVEEQNMMLNREINNLKSQLEEQEKDADEILKKYQNHIQNYSFDSHKFIDLSNQIDILTIENRILKEKIRELEEKVGFYESSWVDKMTLNKIEGKVRDLECKLDLETTHKHRLQNQLERVKQQYEKSLHDIDVISSREKKCEDALKKTHKQNREYLEELGDLRKKLIDIEETRKRLDQQNEILEKELESSRGEIKVNQNRLEAFQNAFNLMNNDEDEEEDDDYIDDEDDEDNDDLEEDELDDDSSSMDRLSQYTNSHHHRNDTNLRQSIEENGLFSNNNHDSTTTSVVGSYVH